MNRLKCIFGFHKWSFKKEAITRLFYESLHQCDYCGKYKDILVSNHSRAVSVEVRKEPFLYWKDAEEE